MFGFFETGRFDIAIPVKSEIDETVTVGTSGSPLLATQAVVKLLDWGMNTGLGTDEIEDAAATWLSQQGDNLDDCLHKLSLVDDASLNGKTYDGMLHTLQNYCLMRIQKK